MKMIRFYSSLLILSAVSMAATLNPGDPIPAIEGNNLNSKTVQLPNAVNGKVSVFAFGFSKDASAPVRGWASKIQEEYPNVPVYQIPVLEGVPRLFRSFAVSGIRSDTTPANRDYLVLLYREEKQWRERLQVGDEKIAYLVVVDAQGRVVDRFAGMLEAPLIEKLRTAINKANKR
ncbi:hypothetical protein WDZ92_02810 [Nostoc sp. NIES-2111]